jgi:hypothetical protein
MKAAGSQKCQMGHGPAERSQAPVRRGGQSDVDLDRGVGGARHPLAELGGEARQMAIENDAHLRLEIGQVAAAGDGQGSAMDSKSGGDLRVVVHGTEVGELEIQIPVTRVPEIDLQASDRKPVVAPEHGRGSADEILHEQPFHQQFRRGGNVGGQRAAQLAERPGVLIDDLDRANVQRGIGSVGDPAANAVEPACQPEVVLAEQADVRSAGAFDSEIDLGAEVVEIRPLYEIERESVGISSDDFGAGLVGAAVDLVWGAVDDDDLEILRALGDDRVQGGGDPTLAAMDRNDESQKGLRTFSAGGVSCAPRDISQSGARPSRKRASLPPTMASRNPPNTFWMPSVTSKVPATAGRTL